MLIIQKKHLLNTKIWKSLNEKNARCPICNASLTCYSFYSDMGRCYGGYFHKYSKSKSFGTEYVEVFTKKNKYVLGVCQYINSWIMKYHNTKDPEFFEVYYNIDILKFFNDPEKTFKRIKASQIFS